MFDKLQFVDYSSGLRKDAGGGTCHFANGAAETRPSGSVSQAKTLRYRACLTRGEAIGGNATVRERAKRSEADVDSTTSHTFNIIPPLQLL